MTEHEVQKAVFNYLRAQYPHVIAFGNAWDGVQIRSQRIAKRAKEAGLVRGIPDVFIEAPRGQYHGCRIELKAKGKGPFHFMPQKKCLRIENNSDEGDHLREQAIKIHQLNKAGYFACFAEGFDQAKIAIDWYLSGALPSDKILHQSFKFGAFVITIPKVSYHAKAIFQAP